MHVLAGMQSEHPAKTAEHIQPQPRNHIGLAFFFTTCSAHVVDFGCFDFAGTSRAGQEGTISSPLMIGFVFTKIGNSISYVWAVGSFQDSLWYVLTTFVTTFLKAKLAFASTEARFIAQKGQGKCVVFHTCVVNNGSATADGAEAAAADPATASALTLRSGREAVEVKKNLYSRPWTRTRTSGARPTLYRRIHDARS